MWWLGYSTFIPRYPAFERYIRGDGDPSRQEVDHENQYPGEKDSILDTV